MVQLLGIQWFYLVASFSYFIIVFHVFDGNYGLAGTWPAWFSTLSAIVTAVVIPIVSWIANRWGKKQRLLSLPYSRLLAMH